ANDYSVCTTWRMVKADYYLIDVFRARLEYPDLRRKIARLVAQYGTETILVERAGPGLTLLQDLRRDLPIRMTRPIRETTEGHKPANLPMTQARLSPTCSSRSAGLR